MATILTRVQVTNNSCIQGRPKNHAQTLRIRHRRVFELWTLVKQSRDWLNRRPLTSAMMDALACLFCIVFILGSVVLSLLILAGIWWREKSGESQFQVVVLGDAGRSPRMQYHCLSLVQLNYNVDLVAYGGNYVAQWFKRLLLIVLHSCKHTYNLAKKLHVLGCSRIPFFLAFICSRIPLSNACTVSSFLL